jgi:hypothetical protein
MMTKAPKPDTIEAGSGTTAATEMAPALLV